MIGAAKTGFVPIAVLCGLSMVHSIGRSAVPTPGSSGIPDTNVASKINEFPVVEPIASEMDLVGPEPPLSSGFFQIYEPSGAFGPRLGESPQ